MPRCSPSVPQIRTVWSYEAESSAAGDAEFGSSMRCKEDTESVCACTDQSSLHEDGSRSVLYGFFLPATTGAENDDRLSRAGADPILPSTIYGATVH